MPVPRHVAPRVGFRVGDRVRRRGSRAYGEVFSLGKPVAPPVNYRIAIKFDGCPCPIWLPATEIELLDVIDDLGRLAE